MFNIEDVMIESVRGTNEANGDFTINLIGGRIAFQAGGETHYHGFQYDYNLNVNVPAGGDRLAVAKTIVEDMLLNNNDFFVQAYNSVTIFAAQLNLSPATLEEVVTDQLRKITRAFREESNQDYVDANGVVWSGGLSSASTINGEIQLVEAEGRETADLWTKDGDEISMPLADARALAIAIGQAYKTSFAKFKGLEKQLNVLLASGDETQIDAALAINW